MTVRNVLVNWLDRVDLEYPANLAKEDQRELVADIFTEDNGWLFDSFAEELSKSPALEYELIEAYREGDFLQVGAVIDKVFTRYVMKGEWLGREFRIVAEQEGRYDGE